jgi:iron complex outermembrane receptor protein
MRIAKLSACALTLGILSAPLHAQDAAPVGDTATLDEVVVTAQKREENLQKVAVSVTALTSEAIENKGIVQFSDLTHAVPSLTIVQASVATNSSIFLRGIGTQAFSIAVDPSVSVVVDDVAVIQQAQAFANLADIERVEVLRGPQGTLFGKNASAGVVNVVTKGPSEKLAATAQLTGTDDHEIKTELSLSGPFGSAGDSGFRISGYSTTRDGYIKNLATAQDLNNARDNGFRGKLQFNFSERLKLRLSGDYSDSNSRGSVSTLRSVPTGTAFFGAIPLAPFIAGITPGVDNFTVNVDDVPFQKSTQSSGNAKLSYDLAASQLVSVTSYQDWAYSNFEDVDGTTINVLASPLGAAGRSGGLVQGGAFHAFQLAEELRLVSTGSGPLKWMVGAYYSDSTTGRAFHRNSNSGLITGPLAGFNANWQARAGNKSTAAFTQLDYSFTDKTRVTAGLRFANEKIAVSFTNLIPAVPLNFAGNNSSDKTAWKVALQQDVADQVMLFATVASGYKGQGYDVSTGFSQSRIDNLVKGEDSRTYEIGIKSRYMDNRVQVNATAFLTNYKQFQAQSAIITATGPLLVLGNIPELRTRGIEVEFTAKPMAALLIDSSVAYVDAKIQDDPFAPCYTGQTAAAGCIPAVAANPAAVPPTPAVPAHQVLSGQPLANSPKFKYNIGATLDFPVASRWKGFASLNYQHQSDVNFDLFRNPLTVQPAYGLLNGNVGLSDGPDGHWKLTLFVNNLLDKPYVNGITDSAGTFGGTHVLLQQLPRDARRYAGLRVHFQL